MESCWMLNLSATLITVWIDNVNVVLNKYEGKNGKSLWVKSMEVFQKMDDDPISLRHANVNSDQSDEEDDLI